MARLSRAALGTAAGRDYARRGWQISETGAAPAGGGAYERMGGLDGFKGMQDARRAGVPVGQPSWFTNPFRNLPGVGEDMRRGMQMSQQTGGGRSARTGMSMFQPGGGAFDTGMATQKSDGEWEFDRKGYEAAVKKQNAMAAGGATFSGAPDPSQFWRRRNNVVPFRPGAQTQGPLQRSAWSAI